MTDVGPLDPVPRGLVRVDDVAELRAGAVWVAACVPCGAPHWEILVRPGSPALCPWHQDQGLAYCPPGASWVDVTGCAEGEAPCYGYAVHQGLIYRQVDDQLDGELRQGRRLYFASGTADRD